MASLNNPEEEEAIQIAMHPALVKPFKDWLAGRGLELRCIGTIDDDTFPTWIVSPTDETIERAY